MAQKPQSSIREQYKSIFRQRGYDPDKCHIVTFIPPAGTVEALHCKMMLSNIYYVFFDKNQDSAIIGLNPDQNETNFIQELNGLYEEQS